MDRSELNRRAFGKLGGLVAGAGLGFAADKDKDKDKPKMKDKDKPLLLQEPNVCRGLNICKGKGKGGKNDCAGTSACATADPQKKGKNDCAGLGGCGATPGENKCKGMGSCDVPLPDHAWGKARANFEKAMKKADKKFGDAPEKPKDKDKGTDK